jgi:hypothetical protein
MQITDNYGDRLLGSLYAKVMGYLPEERAGFWVQFTSVPPEATMYFQELLALSAPGQHG